MQHYWSLENVHLTDVWLTIGSFDGVHIGHRAIIRELVAGAHAEGVPAVVLTFHPHPLIVLRGPRGPFYLTTPELRAELLGELGVDVVIIHPFNPEVASLSARDFVDNLHQHLKLRRLCVGPDFALGHGREGNLARLQQLGEEFGYTLDVIQPISLGGQTVSSSAIRTALADGDLETANRMLGRAYQVNGPIVQGDGRGRTLGIPTANLDVWPEQVLPKAGVYACRAYVEGRGWPAVTNVGVRPTFDNQSVNPHVEAHLLNVNQDLYGQNMTLEFIARLRDEQRFPSVQALVTQIHRDIDQAKEALKDG